MRRDERKREIKLEKGKHKYRVCFAAICLSAIFCITISGIADDRTYTDAQKVFLQEVYEHMTNKDTEFDVVCEDSGVKWDIEDIYYVLSQIDSPSTCDDYDYLRGNISSVECISTSTGYSSVTYKFKFEWLEDREQTDWVNDEVNKILDDNGVMKMNDYEKVKFIHDYIVENVVYDQSKQYFSAYDGLARGTTVCQGYALLTYRMLTQAGVRCRYIVGKYIPQGAQTGENHAWNIVKLGNKWYYLDTTWDSCNFHTIPSEKNKYIYFLKGSSSFNIEHIPDDVENGEDFRQLYDISTVDFNANLGSGNLAQTAGSDDAVTPREFFKLSGDGTIESGSSLLNFFDNIYEIVTTRTLELVCAVVVIIILLILVYRRKEY